MGFDEWDKCDHATLERVRSRVVEGMAQLQRWRCPKCGWNFIPYEQGGSKAALQRLSR